MLTSTPGTHVAIVGRSPDVARAACIERSEVVGRIMLAELVRPRELGPDASVVDAF